MNLTPERIVARYREQGALAYEGEGITQLQHAWQCGQLAAQAGVPAPLQLAAWLHDLGHLLTGLEGSPTTRGIDDGHQGLAARALRPLFGEAVAEPVALHVQAKRYLVAVHPVYRERLSPDSVRSLALQGGPMAQPEALRFRSLPWADEALRLRAWDDAGKLSHWQPADAEAALHELEQLMQRVQRAAV
jgi:phosphonate degradation associated HDIG domain protein